MKHLNYLGVIVVFLLLPSSALRAQSAYDIRPLFELDQLSTGEAYAWISDDGLRIYYTAFDDIHGVYALWSSQRPHLDARFESHKKMQVNSGTEDNFSCWLNIDETKMAFIRRDSLNDTDTGLFITKRADRHSTFSEPQRIQLTGGLKGTILSPSFTQDMKQLIIFNEFGGESFILIFKRTGPYEYGFDAQLSFPARFRAKTGKISADGKEYYMSVQERSKKPYLYILRRNSLDEGFTAFGKYPDKGINDPDCRNHQVYLSSNRNFVVFTRSIENRWSSNGIYIAQNKNYAVPEIDETATKSDFLDRIILFPNPSVDNVYFKNAEDHNITVLMYNASGNLAQTLNDIQDESALDIDHLIPGAYYFKIIDNASGDYRVIKHIKL